jgi:hypothetical protein
MYNEENEVLDLVDLLNTLPEEEDTLLQWRQEAGIYHGEVAISSSKLFAHYERYCQSADIRPLSHKGWAVKMREAGFEHDRKNTGIVYLVSTTI